MPTVMLTTKCPNSCEWCFARAKMEAYRARGIEEMSWEDFLAVVSFYEKSGLNHMILLGGEPTLHSRFEDILELLGSRNFTVLVVTNGLCEKTLVDNLVRKKIPGVQFGVNTTPYFHYPADTRVKADYFMSRINYPVSLSYTVTADDLRAGSVHPLLDRISMIMNFGLTRHIHFQIAVPARENTGYVPFEDYGAVLQLLVRWSKILRKNGISKGLDCHSMPKCFLKNIENAPFAFHSKCEDFMIDIGPCLEVWPCFPLSEHSCNLSQFENLDDVRKCFSKVGSCEAIIYEECCSECESRMDGTCDAGCRGFQLVRSRALLSARSGGKDQAGVMEYWNSGMVGNNL